MHEEGHSECSQLEYCIKEGEKDIPGLTVSTVCLWLGSKETAESGSFRSLKQMMMSADALSESS